MNSVGINDRLLTLWSSLTADDTFSRVPLLYGDIRKNALVFVGLNPSFSIDGWKYLIAKGGVPAIDPETYFAYPPLPQFSVEIVLQLEERAKQEYQFFAQHQALAERLGLHWDHLDCKRLGEPP